MSFEVEERIRCDKCRQVCALKTDGAREWHYPLGKQPAWLQVFVSRREILHVTVHLCGECGDPRLQEIVQAADRIVAKMGPPGSAPEAPGIPDPDPII